MNPSGLCGAGAALLAGRVGRADDARPARAKSVIQIWLAGGPSHVDSFDPKPAAGNDYCGPLNNPIATNADGIRIGELLPLLAKQADKFSLIRSMTHGDNGHETAAYLTQTGRRPGDRLVFPCAGAVVSLFKGYDGGYKGLIPPYTVLTQSQGRFSEAGFLGARHMPFATGGDQVQQKFLLEGVSSPGLNEQQQEKRRRLLRKLNTLGGALPNNPALTVFYQAEEQAYAMILGDGAKAFDLSQETDEMRRRKRYLMDPGRERLPSPRRANPGADFRWNRSDSPVARSGFPMLPGGRRSGPRWRGSESKRTT